VIVHVDVSSPVPVFEQLRSQIERIVLAGQLGPGDRLPTIRDLANDLGLARGTVNKVYDALAADGLVETRGRHGTFVREAPDATADPGAVSARVDLGAAADGLALVVVQLGLGDTEAYLALRTALDRLRSDDRLSGPAAVGPSATDQPAAGERGRR
jgi:DNA-binding transcriptional regulator YhcF (GntR family)